MVKSQPMNRRWRMLACVLLLVALSACSGSSGWYVVSPALPQGRTNLWFLAQGFQLTIMVSLTAICFSMTLGLLIALPAFSRRPGMRACNRVYVELVRAVPVFVMIIWVHYALPVLTGVRTDPFWSGVIALALSDSAFEAEVFRAGIKSVPRGQGEAARSIGLTQVQTFIHIILPQAIRHILPALGNQFVYMLKMSALVSVIGVEELMKHANYLTTSEYRPLEIYSILVLEYLVLILLVSYGVRCLERRLATTAR